LPCSRAVRRSERASLSITRKPRANAILTTAFIWIEGSSTEFPVLVVGDANGATRRTQIGTYDRKLARKALGPFERDELFVDDEIKMEVGHVNRFKSIRART
jgi:hypothetical protein